MIVLGGTLQILCSDREEVLRSLTALADATNSETDGPLAFHFGIDLKDENLVHVYEEWHHVEHLKAHGQQPHMNVYRALRADDKIKILRFSRWRAEELGDF